MGYIYKITNLVNNKIYIGKTTRNIEIRWNEHKRDYLRPEKDNKLYRAMKKYSIENFDITQICECNNDELSDMEKYYIKQFNSYYDGYNSTFGGEGESCIDADLIIKLYNENYTIKQIEKITGHTQKSCSQILKSHNIKIDHRRCEKTKRGKKIYFVEYNMFFNSITDTADFMIKNGIISLSQRKSAITQISAICNKYKDNKSYYGYTFEFA